MIRFLIAVAITLAVVAPARAQDGPSPEQINQAIDQGIAYLKRIQSTDGTWNYPGHELGMTALGGLALFESQVPRDDPAIVRAEEYVRRRGPDETQTYDLGLAILFLSRLYPDDQGEVRDRIRNMAWKLAAGQQGGAWAYSNPPRPPFPLPIRERSTPPLASAAPPTAEQAGKPTEESAQPGSAEGRDPAAESAGKAPSVSGLGAPSASKKEDRPADGPADKLKPGDEDAPAPIPSDGPEKADVRASKVAKKPTVNRNTARREAKARQDQLRLMRSYGDHSNTQLGMLGVWAAGQYGYDSRSVLTNLGERFHQVQRADGAWGYRADGSVVHGPEAMTCVGVLALYLAAGNDDGDGRDALSRGQELERDRAYRRGMEAVTAYAKQIGPQSPTYFLWSLERLCVALGKETLDGFDWYRAGAQVLVNRQALDGSWNDGQWGQNADTCLALLFLHRSNLARGIEKEVRLAEYKDVSGLPTVARRVGPPEGPGAEPPSPEGEPPIVANPNPPSNAGTDPGPNKVAIEEAPPPSDPETRPIDDPARGERSSVPETEEGIGPFEPRLGIAVVVALLVLMALPALVGRWSAKP